MSQSPSARKALLDASQHNTLAPQPGPLQAPQTSLLEAFDFPVPEAAPPIQMQEIRIPEQHKMPFGLPAPQPMDAEDVAAEVPAGIPPPEPNLVPDDDGFLIDLNRPMLANNDGSFSTENTITVSGEELGFTGPSKYRTRYFNIPTIWNGMPKSDGDSVGLARDHLINGGYAFPHYAFREEADAAAFKRSQRIRFHRDPDRSPGAAFMFGTKKMLSSTKRFVADAFENLARSRQRPGEELDTSKYDLIRQASDELEAENLAGGFKPMSFREIEDWQSLSTYITTTISQSAPYMATSLITAGTASPIMMAGETHSHLEQIKDLPLEDRVRYSAVGGAIAGALELVGMGFIVKGIPRELISRYGIKGLVELTGKTNPETAKQLAAKVFTDSFAAGIAESLTEMGQEETFMAMEGWAGREISDEEASLRRQEAAVGGFTAGMPLGGAASLTGVGKQKVAENIEMNQQAALEDQVVTDILRQQALEDATAATLPPQPGTSETPPTITQVSPPTVEGPDARPIDAPSTIDPAPVSLPEITPEGVGETEVTLPETTELQPPTTEITAPKIEPEAPTTEPVDVPPPPDPKPDFYSPGGTKRINEPDSVERRLAQKTYPPRQIEVDYGIPITEPETFEKLTNLKLPEGYTKVDDTFVKDVITPYVVDVLTLNDDFENYIRETLYPDKGKFFDIENELMFGKKLAPTQAMNMLLRMIDFEEVNNVKLERQTEHYGFVGIVAPAPPVQQPDAPIEGPKPPVKESGIEAFEKKKKLASSQGFELDTTTKLLKEATRKIQKFSDSKLKVRQFYRDPTIEDGYVVVNLEEVIPDPDSPRGKTVDVGHFILRPDLQPHTVDGAFVDFDTFEEALQEAKRLSPKIPEAPKEKPGFWSKMAPEFSNSISSLKRKQGPESTIRPLDSEDRTKIKPPNSDIELESMQAVVELDDLKQATGDLQIRDRSRLESDRGVRDRAQNLDVPQITENSRTSDTGSPIITPDGTIISGNGRALTLDLVFTDPAFAEQKQQYLDYILQQAPRAKDFKKPILVRELTGANKIGDPVTPELLKEFATASNEAAVSALSATEQAKRDADALNLETLDLYKGGRLTNTDNAMFISAFDKRVVPKSEQGQFYNKGALTLEGEKRIQNAILAKAYDDPTALERMLESTGTDNVKALSEGLRDAAPAFAKLKVADNITEEMKAIPQKLVDAVNKISELRNDKTIPNPVKEYFNQGSLFQEDADPIRDAFIAAFYDEEKTRPKSKEYIRDMVQFLVDEVMGQEPGGLPGLENTVEAGTVIDIAERKAREREDVRKERRNARKQKSLPGIDEARSESFDADSEQAQPSGRKKSRTKAKRDSGPDLDADTSTRGEPEVSRRDTGTRAKDKSNLPPKGKRTGTVHEKESSNPRISYFRQAFTDAGFDNWQEAENLPPKEKRRILDKLVREKFGISFIQTSPDNKAMADDLDNLLDAYRQLQVMAHTLQLPNSAIGLDGSLGLALPGKDWGGYYAAFYNSGRGEIGPVQTKSDLPPMQPPFIIMPGRSTSFGHEWGHALDYHILENLGTDWDRGMSARIRKLKDDDQAWEKEVHEADDPQLRELQLAFGEVMNTLFFDMDDVASQIMYLEHQIAKKEAFHVRSGEKLGVNESKSLQKDKRQLKEILEGSTNKEIKESRIRERVKEFSKAPYWQRPTEMFARAFETYLAHLVTKANYSTEFITSTDAAYQLTLEQAKDADVRFPLTHPQEEDRLQVFMAFDRLFAAIQASPDLLQGEAAPAPGDYDIIDMRQYFTGERAFSIFDRKAWKQKNAEDKRKIQAARNRLKAEKMRPVRFSDRPWFEQQQIKLQDNFLYPVLRSKTATMLGIRDRYKNDPVVKSAMEDLISRLVTEPGASIPTFKEGVFSEATQMEVRRFAHVYKKIINDPDNLLDGLTAKQTEDLRLLMTSDPDTLKKMLKKDLDPKLVKGAGELRTLLTNVYRYLKRNDVNINFLAENNYLPRILDNPLVFADPYKFIYGDKKQRGAKPLYKEVLWVNDYGIFDNSADQIVDIASIKKFPYSQLIEDDDSPVKILREVASTIRENYLDIAKAKADLDKLKDIKETDPDKHLSEKARLEGEIEAAQDRIDEALALNEDALAEAYEEVSDLWAELGSTDWLLRIQQMAGEDPNAHSPMGRFTKSRTLPAEADTYMVDFYMDPIEAISNYITAAVRKAEYNKRFGPQLVPKKHKIFKQTGQKRSYLDYLFQVKMAGRMDPADIEQIRLTVEFLTGTQGHFRDSGFQKLLNMVHAIGTMALLPRAAISSIAEPMTTGITAESSLKGIEAFALSVEEAFAMVSKKSDQRVRLRKQMAEILGVVDDPEIGEMVANRLGGTFADNPKIAARMSTYFRRTLLQGLTNAQRRSSMRVGIKYIQELSQEYLEIKEKNQKQGAAMDNLIDFGVPESDLDQFATFMTQFDTRMPDVDQLQEKDGDLTDMGRIMALAVGRFTNRSIQDPNSMDRPRYAEHPMGRIVYGIMSFSYSFGRNVLVASYKKTKREYENRGLTSANLMAAKLGGAMFSLYLSHTLVNAVRERLTNEERWKEKKAEGNLGLYLAEMGLYRSGVTGAFDPLFQATRSLKYQVDLSNLLIGAGPTYFARAIERITRAAYWETNSGKTPAAEYQALIALWELIVIPMTAWHVAANPLFGTGLGLSRHAIAGLAPAWISAPDMKFMYAHETLKFLTGESYSPKKGRQAKKKKEKKYAGF